MTGRRHVGLVAAGATLLAAVPLYTIFEQWTWLIQCIVAVALIEGAATLVRTLRGAVWAQTAAMAGTLLLVLTFLFPSRGEVLGIIPTGETFAGFGDLLAQAGTGMRQLGIPVGEHRGLAFLTVLGVGIVAICVDLCAVALRRPALAGLPMLAIYSVPVAVHQGSVHWLPFIAGACGFLWLLVIDNVDRVRRFGRRFTGDGRDIDVWEPSPLAAAGRRLAIVGVLVAVVLPLAVPGMTSGLMDRFGPGGGDGLTGPRSGNGRTVNLWAMLSGTLNQQQETEMIRVSTDDPNPGYLRFGVADDLIMEGFRNRQPSGRQGANNLPDPRRDRRAGVTFRDGRASVEVVSYNMNLLPVYAEPVALTKGVDSSWFFDRQMQVVFSSRNNANNKKYEFTFARPDFDPAALRRVSRLPQNNEIMQRYTQVPDGVGDVEAKVAELTRGKTNDYDRVRALYDYFSARNGFTYTVQVPPDTGGPAIVNFLTKKSGYCVQYAAALAWMVREAGIPARVAFGFTEGRKDDRNVFRLTNRNLHAWTEVYFDGFGWVTFDATPSTFVAGSVDPPWAPNPEAPDEGGSGPLGPTPGPDDTPGPGASGAGPGGRPELPEDTGFIGPTGGPDSPRWPGYVLAGMIVLLAILALPALRRMTLRRQRDRRPAGAALGVAAGGGVPGDGEPRVVAVGGVAMVRARQDAHAAWDELIDTLVDYRIAVDEAETPRGTADRVIREADLRDAAAAGASLLGRAEERARYARDPLVGAELRASLKAVRRAIAGRASRRTRWTALVLPPSVIQRWRMATLIRGAATVGWFGRQRDGVVRALSPRRWLLSRGARQT